MNKPGPKEDTREITNGKYWCRRMLREHWPPFFPQGWTLPEMYVIKLRPVEDTMEGEKE